jgi:hypothetical protein
MDQSIHRSIAEGQPPPQVDKRTLTHDCPLCAAEALAFCWEAIPGRLYFHCQRCDLRFLRQADRVGAYEEKRIYDLHENDPEDPRYQKFVMPIFRSITAHYPQQSRGLDFGSGRGSALQLLFRRAGFEVDLYDPYYHPSVLRDGTYDFVYACEVAEHLFSPGIEYARLHSLLRPGGALALMTLLYDGGQDFNRWYYRMDPTHVAFYSIQTLEWIRKHFGFSRLETDDSRLAIFFL